MSHQMLTIVLSDPKTFVQRDLLYNRNANEWIVVIIIMEPKHGKLSLARTNIAV